MARIDSLTREFVDKIASDSPLTTEDPPKKDSVSKGVKILKQVVQGAENPKKALGKLLVRTVASDLMDKQGSTKILALYKYMNEKFDRDWWDWEPETIWAEVEREHPGDSTPEEIKGAIMAIQVTLNTHYPFEHWHVFEKVGHAFNYNHVDFNVLQPLEPDEAALTMEILKRIRPKEGYDDEVLRYIAVCCHNAGMVWVPEELLPGVQSHLADITFDAELRDKTQKNWEDGGSDGVSVFVDIQMARIKEIRDYVEKEI